MANLSNLSVLPCLGFKKGFSLLVMDKPLAMDFMLK